MRAATDSCPLATDATDPTLAARYRQRRPTVPPAARTDTFQASVRASSASSCRAAATPSSPSGAVCRAAVKLWLLPFSAATRTATTASVTRTVSAGRTRARHARRFGGNTASPLVEPRGRIT